MKQNENTSVKAYERLFNLSKKRSQNTSMSKIDPNHLSPSRPSMLNRKRSNPEFEVISRLYEDAFKRNEQAKELKKQEQERYKKDIRRSVSPPNKTSQQINSKCIQEKISKELKETYNRLGFTLNDLLNYH